MLCNSKTPGQDCGFPLLANLCRRREEVGVYEVEKGVLALDGSIVGIKKRNH